MDRTRSTVSIASNCRKYIFSLASFHKAIQFLLEWKKTTRDSNEEGKAKRRQSIYFGNHVGKVQNCLKADEDCEELETVSQKQGTKL